MAEYGPGSKKRLKTVHPLLRLVFETVVKDVDNTITEGERGEQKQNEYFATGRSKLKYPKSNHNKKPGQQYVRALDAAPWPIDWTDRERFYFFAGAVKATASMLGIKIRWGGDWDGDNDFKDQTFDDLMHFELQEDA
jgi:peptidoglycan L-alanyl-D-glutamate endopeptidase CwlK